MSTRRTLSLERDLEDWPDVPDKNVFLKSDDVIIT